MNANELIQILENGGAWEDDEGNIHGLPDGDLERAISEAIDIISRYRIRETATEPPTMRDGIVLAFFSPLRSWEKVKWDFLIRHSEKFTQWTQLPEAPHDNT